jgi:hypothetical protein
MSWWEVVSRYTIPVMVVSMKKKGPYNLSLLRAQNTFTFGLLRTCSSVQICILFQSYKALFETPSISKICLKWKSSAFLTHSKFACYSHNKQAEDHFLLGYEAARFSTNLRCFLLQVGWLLGSLLGLEHGGNMFFRKGNKFLPALCYYVALMTSDPRGDPFAKSRSGFVVMQCRLDIQIIRRWLTGFKEMN